MKRITVAQKFLLVLVSLLILFSASLAGLLINRSQTDLSAQQRQIQTQYHKQMQLLESFVSNRLVTFIEGFASYADARKLTSQVQYQQALTAQYDELVMRWQVDDIAFIGNEATVVEGSLINVTAPAISTLVQNVRLQQRPLSQLECDQTCSRLLGVPVITDEGLAVIVTQYSFAEIFASFARSTLAQITMVKMQFDDASPLALIGQLTDVNLRRFEQYIALLPSNIDRDEFYQHGHVITDQERMLLMVLLPLSSDMGNPYFALALTDVTDFHSAQRNYHGLVIAMAVGMSLSFITLVTLLLRQYGRKLHNLSQRLPLLAENRFEEFRDLRIHRSRWFEDDLDQLEASADTLAKNLEQLNQQSVADQMQLEKMAMFDGLTGLPNRSMMVFQIDKHLASLNRSNKALALMFLDLDDFKKINDSHGHSVGDALLKRVSRRISEQLRESDIAARFGGDEYAILLTDIDNIDDVNVVAEKVLKAFKEEITVKQHTFFVTVSIGVAITQDGDITAAELLRHADIAMYEAKVVSDSTYRIYDAAMNLKLQRRVELEDEARTALQNDQFYLALQPKIEMESGRLVGFESLIRWNHPSKGAISPAEFIPILEKSTLMGKLDYWVIARSMSILSQLSLEGFSNLTLAINVSASQFVDTNIVDYLRQQLRHFNLKAHQIELELTETALVHDLTRACEVMSEIRELGCKIAIDDFGTGYSSLSYLKALPADAVKIDRSFVSGMLDDHSDRNIVYSTISMVRSLDIEVVAEGVETASQFDLLCEFGCHVGQGYFISRPIVEGDLWSALETQCEQGIWKLPLPTA